METRGTGLTPQRLPSEWEKETLEMTKESPQGPEKTSRPTSRDFTPAALDSARGGGFMGAVMRSRPSAQVEARAGVMEPISSDAQQVLQEAGGLAEFNVTGDGIAEPQERPGDLAALHDGFPGDGGIMTTKGGVKGKTLAKGAI